MPMARSFVLLLLLSGCSPGEAADGGTDSSLDAPSPRDVPRDLGPACELACGVAEYCCIVEGAPACVNTSSDPANCGTCGTECILSRRGDQCLRGRCACGRFDVGCTGTSDVCCPATTEIEAHCANLRVAEQDCGECGRACTAGQASVCQNGECICEGSDRGCAGTPEDLCCPGGLSVITHACTNTLTDREHCGACDRRCELGERCDAGRCVGIFDVPPPDAGVDAAVDDAG
jgi:hypothetical protein